MCCVCSKNLVLIFWFCLEGNGGIFLFFVIIEFEVFVLFEGELVFGFVDSVFEMEDNFFGLLGEKYSCKEWIRWVNG